jgi:uncharacterized protein (TIGR01244 family)
MTMDISRYIPQYRHPRPDLYTGGQPDAPAWPQLAEAGVRTVVNLRPVAEMAGRNEAAEVASAGLTYVNVPIGGPDNLGRDEVAALWSALESSSGPVLVHCGTGNRCGALLALAEAWHRGSTPDEALAFGQRAGLSSLEPAVRTILS